MTILKEIWLVLLPFIAFGEQYVHRTFYRIQDKSLTGNVTTAGEVKSALDCSFTCLQYGPFACLSFNFNTTKNENGFHLCEINNSERYLEPHKVQERPSYDYYGTTAKVSSFKVFLFNCTI